MDRLHIHWAIVGGESGPKARPIKENWIDKIHDACKYYKTAFFLNKIQLIFRCCAIARPFSAARMTCFTSDFLNMLNTFVILLHLSTWGDEATQRGSCMTKKPSRLNETRII